MKLALSDEMNKIDEYIMNDIGIPGAVLMENAGGIVAQQICDDFDNLKNVLIISGVGNNGGDGFVIARRLHEKGVNVKVIVVGQPKEMQSDAQLYFQIIKTLGLPIYNINDAGAVSQLEKIIPVQDVVVDALFGTGLSKPIEGFYAMIVEVVNRLSKYIFAVDVPSGVDSNSGQILGVAIKANKTISFIYPKIGNIMYPAADCCGELLVKSIGVGTDFIPTETMKYNVITDDLARKLIPPRPKDSHKGTYGTACVIAGSSGMTGAAILTCKAALRCGLGLLKLYIPESLRHLITMSIPEAVIVPIEEMRRGVVSLSQIDYIVSNVGESSVVAVGPGCGVSGEMSEMIRRLITELDNPLIIDADGLNALAKNVDWLNEKKSQIILTPHPGEMARLLDTTIEEVMLNPIDTATSFAKKYGVIVVLKSSRTVIANPSGEVYVNVNGNTGMATGGTGDVLTGIITGFIAQGLSLYHAAILGVYIHGSAGDEMSVSKGEFGLVATDLVEGMPYAFRKLGV